MIATIEQLFACTILGWADPDPESTPFAAVQNGVVILADSVELLIAALTEGLGEGLRVAA
jgi:hypothetical protein